LSILCENGNQFGLNPLFVNPAISDFHLQPCSPAINAGANAILDSLGITTDLDGNPRIRNGVVDIGPYEQHISLNPSLLAQPACAGASDGAVGFDADICPPYSFSWSNGVTSGTQTDGLAAGTYVFTAIGSNNIPVTDTILISEPLPLEVIAEGHDVTCTGSSNGWVEASATGGTAPYMYTWDGIVSSFNLSPGTYTVQATDAHGCTTGAQAIIGAPDPFEFFYTIQDATCMTCPNGSIVFDSIIGGNNPPLPAAVTGLLPGNYSYTLTDAAGCIAIVNYTIGFTTKTTAPEDSALLKLSPNPTQYGEMASLQWLGREPAVLQILDLQGKTLEKKLVSPDTVTSLTALWPSGIYQIQILTASGKGLFQSWVII
jgi:hypothetical protein